ncbi:MAG: hypothetical protein ABI430_01295 [Candidatus Taylorbacteria bacterium]
MKIFGNGLAHVRDVHRTKSEIESLKRWLFIAWETTAVLVTLISLIFAWKYRAFWTVFPVLVVACVVGFRIVRRAHRRCPRCSIREVTQKDGSVKKKRNLFGGWFVRRNYWREVPPWKFKRHSASRPGWWDDFPKRESEDPGKIVHQCHFHYTCLVCKLDYAVKPPELKSFGHRHPIFWNW